MIQPTSEQVNTLLCRLARRVAEASKTAQHGILPEWRTEAEAVRRSTSAVLVDLVELYCEPVNAVEYAAVLVGKAKRGEL